MPPAAAADNAQVPEAGSLSQIDIPIGNSATTPAVGNQSAAAPLVFPPLPQVSAGSLPSGPSAPGLGLPPLPDPMSIPVPGVGSPALAGANPLPTPPTPAAQLPLSAATPSTLTSFSGPAARPLDSEDLVQFEPGELIAVVGEDHILAGDMNVFIDPIIEKNRDKIRSSQQESEIRMQLTRQVLGQYVEVKAMYQEFFRDMVGTSPPSELEDMKKQVVTKAGKIFFEKQVPNLMEKYEVTNLADLEEKLRQKSVSLSTLRTQFIEQVLSSELERKYVPDEFEIDSESILENYRQDRERWQVPARARWQEITIRLDKHQSPAEAENLLKQLGNEMVLGGKSFEAVARQSSEGFTASEGGYHDWTPRGSLKSKVMEDAIFSIELNKLSRVIEDDIGFHIIRVLEREEAHSKDLAESQAEIRQTLSQVKRNKAAAELRERIMKRTPIWTRWPEDIPGSRPLSQALGE